MGRKLPQGDRIYIPNPYEMQQECQLAWSPIVQAISKQCSVIGMSQKLITLSLITDYYPREIPARGRKRGINVCLSLYAIALEAARTQLHFAPEVGYTGPF